MANIVGEHHLKDLTPDPHNARKHNPRNIGMIVNSLHDVGAARSIVLDENNRILAGNGTVEGAAEAGITKVVIVEADGNELIAVRRSNLDEARKQRLALFDNRSAELAEWDPEVLRAYADDGITAGMFTDKEIAKIIGDDVSPQPSADEQVSERFDVLVTCTSEAQQTAVLTMLMEQGLVCKALVA